MDGLRGVAVLFILVAHFFPRPLAGEYGTPLAYAHRALLLTFSGIDLFFVLSGFFVGGILMRACSQGSPSVDFYLRRAARIVPLATVCMVLTYAGLAVGFHDNFTLAGVEKEYPWWSYAAFISNWHYAFALNWGGGTPLAHLWSLGIEMQFYLVAPPLFLLLRRPSHVAAVLIFIGLGSRLALLKVAPDAAFATHFLPFCRADAFGLGILVAGWLAADEPPAWIAKSRAWLLGVWTAFAIGMLVLTAKNVTAHDALLAGFGYTWIAGFYATSILLLAENPNSPVRRLLASTWPVRLGTYSYFIYLLQDIASRVIGHGYSLFPGISEAWYRFTELPLVLLLLLLVAPLSWKYIESPIIRLAAGRRLPQS